MVLLVLACSQLWGRNKTAMHMGDLARTALQDREHFGPRNDKSERIEPDNHRRQAENG